MLENYMDEIEEEIDEVSEDEAIEEFLRNIHDGRSFEEQKILVKGLFYDIQHQSEEHVLNGIKNFVRLLSHQSDDLYEDSMEKLSNELEDIIEGSKRFS